MEHATDAAASEARGPRLTGNLVEGLRETLFGPRPYAEVVIAEEGGRPVGFALFFHNYSTFLGRPGIYLEDLYVLPEMRGRGVGRALLAHLARRGYRENWRPAGPDSIDISGHHKPVTRIPARGAQRVGRGGWSGYQHLWAALTSREWRVDAREIPCGALDEDEPGGTR